MIVGILQLELAIPGSASLKDKRRVIRSLKDRLHREHLVAVAETARLDALTSAIVSVACVGADHRRIAQTLDRVLDKARRRTDCEVVSSQRRVGHLDLPEPDEPDDIDTAALADELLRHAMDDEP